MTARELYDCDTTFRLLVDEWVRERRCPLPLVDRCLDFDLESQSDCARWAATAEPLKGWGVSPDTLEQRKDTLELVPPYPRLTTDATRQWYWMSVGPSQKREYFHHVPAEFRDVCPTFKIALDAILWLLDNWLRS